MIIRIRKAMDDPEQIKSLGRRWYQSENAEIILPSSLSRQQAHNLVETFVDLLPDAFASAVLAQLAEKNTLNEELQWKIYKLGDISCKVSICLGSNVPSAILEKALTSGVPDIIEHAVFHPSVTISRCRKLLAGRRMRKMTCLAIERAILVKQANRKLRERDKTRVSS